jgi:hypothetical protein
MAAKLAALLSNLKNARVKADYRAEAPMDAPKAHAAVSLSRAVAQLIETAPR